MAKVGIIICSRYSNCGGGKCLRAIRERAGGFARYPKDETVELVGYSSCGGCPGGNVESVPEEMKKNGAQVIHLATGLVVGYPPCPHLREFKELIERKHGLQVVVGTQVKALNLVDISPFGTENDNRHRRKTTKLFKRLKAVHFGHDEVKHYQVWLLSLSLLQGLKATTGGQYLIP